MKREFPSHVGISPETVREALGPATTLDELLVLLEADDVVLQGIGWREWHSLDGVVPVFANDLPPLGGDEWELLSGDAFRLVVLYLDGVRSQWRLLVLER